MKYQHLFGNILMLIFSCELTAFTNVFNTKSNRLNSRFPLQAIELSTSSELTLANLPTLSTKEALGHICSIPSIFKSEWLFPDTEIIKKPPSVCKYIIANPKVFLNNPAIAKLYGVDTSTISENTPLHELAKILPVFYIADTHPEYGTLGLMLNKRSERSVVDFYPSLKRIRDRPVYLGGVNKRGSAFTMVHKKVGFPENRAWKGIPGNSEFRLFFSPDVAMANELCLTDDASPSDFKFFEWATVWLPNELESEYEKKLWIAIQAPVSLLFTDDTPRATAPLYTRIIRSLPQGFIPFPAGVQQINNNE